MPSRGERDQRHSVEYIQALALRVIQGKNFKDTAKQLFTAPTTAMRRFDPLAPRMLEEVVAIDEYKGDTNGERFQVLIANGATGVPLDILLDRKAKTLKRDL